jgi:hypothetical protein
MFRLDTLPNLDLSGDNVGEAELRVIHCLYVLKNAVIRTDTHATYIGESTSMLGEHSYLTGLMLAYKHQLADCNAKGNWFLTVLGRDYLGMIEERHPEVMLKLDFSGAI